MLTHIYPCLGLTDEVLSLRGELLGYVGFHDYDGYYPIEQLRPLIASIAIKLKTTIFCLKTGHGYHPITFEIMSDREKSHWAEAMQKVFPSDYLHKDKDARHRVLRLSEKGKDKPPSFLFAAGLKPELFLSSGHVEEYLNRGLVPEKAFTLLDGCRFIKTRVNLCVFLAKRDD